MRKAGGLDDELYENFFNDCPTECGYEAINRSESTGATIDVELDNICSDAYPKRENRQQSLWTLFLDISIPLTSPVCAWRDASNIYRCPTGAMSSLPGRSYNCNL